MDGISDVKLLQSGETDEESEAPVYICSVCATDIGDDKYNREYCAYDKCKKQINPELKFVCLPDWSVSAHFCDQDCFLGFIEDELINNCHDAEVVTEEEYNKTLESGNNVDKD